MMLALLFIQAYWSGLKQVSRSFDLEPIPHDLCLIVDASPREDSLNQASTPN